MCALGTSHRSASFRATREHHSTELAEDYTELISDLIERDGEARVGSIADNLGVSHVTALRTIGRLQDEGYIERSTRRPVLLTAKGVKTARLAKERHELLVNFLVQLGVPRAVAEVDIEGAEHHFSSVSLRHIAKFMKRSAK